MKPQVVKPPYRVVIVDDSPSQCLVWREFLKDRYGNKVKIETYTNPKDSLKHLTPDIHLLLIDWVMPDLNGHEVLQIATKQGVSPDKIIIISVKPADQLHKVFEPGQCLAVIEKLKPDQLEALLHILDEMFQ